LSKRIFSYLSPEEFKNLDLEKFKCLENQDVTIEGLINGYEYTFISLEASYCGHEYDKDTSKCDIESQKAEIIKNDPGNIIFLMIFQNNIFDPTNYSKPVNNYLEMTLTFLDFQNIKYSSVFLNRRKMVTDNCLIFNSEGDPISIISLEKIENDIISEKYDVNIMASIEVYCSDKEYNYKRSYSKLTEILAEILGFYEYVKIILKILFSATNMKKNIRLINCMFEFDFEKKKIKSLIKSLWMKGIQKFLILKAVQTLKTE
jgi:hypothetical protein